MNIRSLVAVLALAAVAGSAGAQTFDDFRDRIIRHAKTRVLAFLNIASPGMGTGHEDDIEGLDAAGETRPVMAGAKCLDDE